MRLYIRERHSIGFRYISDPRILDLSDALASEALAARGAVLVLIGNHEPMNAYQDFRYVTEHGFEDHDATPVPASPDSAFLALEPARQGVPPHSCRVGRWRAVSPGATRRWRWGWRGTTVAGPRSFELTVPWVVYRGAPFI